MAPMLLQYMFALFVVILRIAPLAESQSTDAGPPSPPSLRANATEGGVVLRSLQDGACCTAVAGTCCPPNTICSVPYGCMPAQPAQESSFLGMGYHTVLLAVVAVLVTGCVCLLLSLCCLKELFGCIFNPGMDGEYSGAQLAGAGLLGGLAGYGMESAMDPRYGGAYPGGYY